MFGGPLSPPKEPKHPRKQHPTPDILNTCREPGIYGHRAREPNTNYHVRLHQYNQRYDELDLQRSDNDYITTGENLCMINFDKHAQNNVFKSEVQARIQVKLQLHEDEVNKRREKLKELFATEEREFVKMTVESCQKGVDDKLNAMKEKCRLLKEKKARDDEKFVQKKRLQQYMIRCMDLIPAMNERNLRESKIIQLQQMRENEARREAERELNKMWAHLQEKEANAKAEREKQELIIRFNKDKKDRDILELQIEGKRLMKEEEKRIATEDRLELLQLAEKIRQEEIQAQEDVRTKRDKICADLLHQIGVQKAFMEQRKREEDALDNAFANLTLSEYAKEQSQIETSTDNARKEAMQYCQYIKDLADLRKEEQRNLDELLRQYQCEINKKMDKAQCDLQEARERLMQNTLKERGEQLEQKKQLARKLLEMKQTENEWMTHIISTNERLMAETQRLSKLAVTQYRDDLSKQIEYNNRLKEREIAQMEHDLQRGKEEELRYMAMVQHLIGQGHSAGSVQHPFRKVLVKRDCHCKPPLMPKY